MCIEGEADPLIGFPGASLMRRWCSRWPAYWRLPSSCTSIRWPRLRKRLHSRWSSPISEPPLRSTVYERIECQTTSESCSTADTLFSPRTVRWSRRPTYSTNRPMMTDSPSTRSVIGFRTTRSTGRFDPPPTRTRRGRERAGAWGFAPRTQVPHQKGAGP